MHEVRQRAFDKEDTKEKREAEDRMRTERKEKEDKDRSYFEKIFLMAIGVGAVNIIKSGKHKKRRNKKDGGSPKKKASKAGIHLISDSSEVDSSNDSNSDEESEASGSTEINLGFFLNS